MVDRQCSLAATPQPRTFACIIITPNSLPVLFSLFSFWSPFPFHYHGRNIVSETDDHDIFLLGGGGLVVATTSKMVHRATAASKMGGIAFSAERRGL
jgi:hypothetical protein